MRILEIMSKVLYLPPKKVWVKLLFCLIVGVRFVTLTLVFPIIAITVGLVILLLGKLSILEFLGDTCKVFIDYYYSGTLFNISAWRYHLVIFLAGFIYELLNDK